EGIRDDLVTGVQTCALPISMTPEEIRRVEEIVNRQILEDTAVAIFTDVPISEAKARGAMALFGEKYGERVRMVEIPGFSLELCRSEERRVGKEGRVRGREGR